MSPVVLTLVSLGLLVAVAALVRERRLRRALQTLLQRLLSHWRRHAQTDTPAAGGGDADGSARDRLPIS